MLALPFALALAWLALAAQDPSPEAPPEPVLRGRTGGGVWRQTFETDGRYLFGHSLAAAGDLDDDGTSDLFIGDPGDMKDGVFRGSVYAISLLKSQGRDEDRQVLWRVRGSSPLQGFGWALQPVEDLDGDGFPELAVGSIFASKVQILSGASGALLWELEDPDGYGGWFGAALTLLPDIDGDGARELAVGQPRRGAEAYPGRTSGAVHVFSLKRRSRLWVAPAGAAGERPGSHHGSALAPIADLDGDGVGDLLVGAPGSPFPLLLSLAMSHLEQVPTEPWSYPRSLEPVLSEAIREGSIAPRGPAVWIHSGKTGAVLRVIEAPSEAEGFGRALASPGDVDGDGVPDFVAGAFLDARDPEHRGSVSWHSGADGSVLRVVRGRGPASRFGAALVLLDDLDGDGIPELAVGDPADGGHGHHNRLGSVAILSGRTGEVSARHATGGPSENVRGLGATLLSLGTVGTRPLIAATACNEGMMGKCYLLPEAREEYDRRIDPPARIQVEGEIRLR